MEALWKFLRRFKPSVYRHPGYVALHVFFPGRISFVWRDRTANCRWGLSIGSLVIKRNGL